MATVRIYKVAELLGLSSQDAIDLLKKETGIDVKSASSSIEEIVARQFVERQARKRNISLPHGAMFADQTVAKKPAGKAGKAAEPPKAAAPVLRPRLVKAVRPAAEAIAEPASAHAVDHAIEAAQAVEEPPVVETPPAPEPVVQEPEPKPVVETPAAVVPVVEPEPEPEPVAAEPVAEEPPAAPKAPPLVPRIPGRVVPPTRRLRIEDPLYN